MSETGQQDGPLNPVSLSVADLVRILIASGFNGATVDTVQADLAKGAPQNPDGTINVAHFAAWLLRETGSGD